MNKSFVTMEQHQCPVCLNVFDTGNLLFHTRLENRFDTHTLTGHSLCKECAKKKADGYIALVGCDSERKPTGAYAHVRDSAWPSIFNVPAPEGGIAHCGADTLEMLRSMVV